MQITITIPDKDIKDQIKYMVKDRLTEEFDDDVLKAAGVKEADMIKAVLEDEKFVAKLNKMITKYAQSQVDGDIIYDAITDVESPAYLHKAYTTCYKLDEKMQQERKAKHQAHQIKASIAMLEQAGFTVSKK